MHVTLQLSISAKKNVTQIHGCELLLTAKTNPYHLIPHQWLTEFITWSTSNCIIVKDR